MATTTSPTVPPVVAKRPITFWRIIGKVIGWFFKTILVLTIIVILSPIVFFALRAGRPMVRLEFAGMTYYEVLAARKAALYNKAVDFQVAHPGRRMWLGQCFYLEIFSLNVLEFPSAGALVVWQWISPNSRHFVGSSASGFQRATNITEIFPVWWENYELMLVKNYKYTQFVSYCNITFPIGP